MGGGTGARPLGRWVVTPLAPRGAEHLGRPTGPAKDPDRVPVSPRRRLNPGDRGPGRQVPAVALGGRWRSSVSWWRCLRRELEHQGARLVEGGLHLVVRGPPGSTPWSSLAFSTAVPRRPRMRASMIAGRVSGSLSSQEWLAPRTTTRSPRARRAADLEVAIGHREVAVAVDGEHRDALLAQLVEHPAGARAAQDRRRRPEQAPRPADVAEDVGPTSRPSLAACRGSRNNGTVVAVSMTSVTPTPTRIGGKTRATLTRRSQVSPTMASRRTTAMARSGSLAASSVTRRPPIEWPASTACGMPRWSSTRPSSSA